MKLFLSDIHLGNPLFKHTDKLLDLLRSDFDSLYLVGDTLDIWEAKLIDIINQNTEIIETIHEVSKVKKVIYVIGNHDPSIIEINTLFPKVTTCDSYVEHLTNNKLMVLIHGHIFDDLILNYSGIARFLFYFQWVAERFNWNMRATFRSLFNSISNKRGLGYYDQLLLDIKNKATGHFPYADIVVMGHTHSPVIYPSEVTYVNCGDWIHSNTYVDFNNIDVSFSLRKIDG